MLFPVNSLIGELCDRLGSDGEYYDDPYPHFVLDDVLPQDFVLGLTDEIRHMDSWIRYDSPLERKSTCNDWHQFGPYLYRYFSAMLSHEIARMIGNRLGVAGLRADVGLHGGGVHLSGDGDKLNVHQDYSLHPKAGFERRVNVIYHVEPMWQESFGGHLELWSGESEPVELRRRVVSRFNRMVVFVTSPGSWHGYAKPISCPPQLTRKTLATYYVSAPSGLASGRLRAHYAPSDAQLGDPYVEALIRDRSR